MPAFSDRALVAWAPFASLTTAMLLWASSFIALKIAFTGYEPMAVVFGRMAVATLLFLFLWPRIARGVVYARGDWAWLLFMSACEPCLYFLFEASALQHTSAAQAGMITAMLPLMVAVGARCFLGERSSGTTWAGFVIAMGGCVWLSLAGGPTEHAPNPILGNLLEFLAMVCAVGYILSLKHLTRRYSPLFLTAWQAFVGSIFFFPLIFIDGSGWPTTIEPVPLLAVVYLGAFVTLGAYGCYNYGVSRVPATRASAFINLIPVFTVLLAYLILGERLFPSQLAASALVFAGVILSQLERPRVPDTLLQPPGGPDH